MGKPPVTKGQGETGNGVGDLLAATQLLYICHLGQCRPSGRFGVLFTLGFPLLPGSCVGNNPYSAWSSSALFLGGGVVTSRSRMNCLWPQKTL